MQVVAHADTILGTSLASRLPEVDPTVHPTGPTPKASAPFPCCNSRVVCQVGNVALAIACNELMEPLRLPLVVASTPTVVRLLRLK